MVRDYLKKARGFMSKLMNDPCYRWYKRALWGLTIDWAGMSIVQSIAYYTYIGFGNQAFKQGQYAELYRSEARYPDSERLYGRVCAIAEHTFGKSSLAYVLSLNNLALLYRDERRYKQAADLYTCALRARQLSLGANHPDTGKT